MSRKTAIRSWRLAFLLPVLSFSAAWAEVKPADVFSDNMVLQQGLAVPVWGTAAPGEKVTVTHGDVKTEAAAQRAETVADKDGNWSLKIGPLSPHAGQPTALTITGENTVTIGNVLVGEVWLCSGQSNMAWPVSKAQDAEREIAEADYPQIRLLTVGYAALDRPARQLRGRWSVCSPQTVGNFSAVAYFFGRELHKQRKVPVGLINSSVGATPIEAWMSAEAMAEAGQARPVAATVGKQAGSGLFNGMIAPLVPCGLRGAIWYQGESNAAQASEYRVLLGGLIRDWRTRWGEGDFPFLIVQLANLRETPNKPAERSLWAELREAQLQALSLPKTGLAVAIDIGEADNIHPKNKQEVGRRLALAARAIAYDEKIVYSGPVYDSMTVEGDKARVRFTHVGGGLVAKGEKLTGFAIAGSDKNFVWADAKIEGDCVAVSSPMVKQPVAVRYAWANNPDCNLYNAEGLPASPFRTDDWALAPQDRKTR